MDRIVLVLVRLGADGDARAVRAMSPSVFPSRWPARLQNWTVYGLVIGNILWATIATKLMTKREADADAKAARAAVLSARADSLFRCLRAQRAIPCR
jgi:hypothetical protein